jgi:hypothetical protein
MTYSLDSNQVMVVQMPEFVLKTTVDYFVNRGACVYAAALDISQAFD